MELIDTCSIWNNSDAESFSFGCAEWLGYFLLRKNVAQFGGDRGVGGREN